MGEKRRESEYRRKAFDEQRAGMPSLDDETRRRPAVPEPPRKQDQPPPTTRPAK